MYNTITTINFIFHSFSNLFYRGYSHLQMITVMLVVPLGLGVNGSFCQISASIANTE